MFPGFFYFCWMPYKITSYTKAKAKKLGVTVKTSKTKGKKLDVFKKGIKVASVGASGYGDFPTFKKKKGIKYALIRQKAYKARHQGNRKVKGSPGYYADQLLW